MVKTLVNPSLRACVVGAGSLGSLVAGYLAMGGIDCSIIAREPLASAIAAHGIQIKQVFSGKAFNVRDVRVLGSMREIDACDVVIFGVKAFDVQATLGSLRDARVLDPSRSTLFLMQNGIGIEDFARAAFPSVPLIRMTTTNGALLVQPGVVHHTGAGEIQLGFWDGVRHAGDDQVIKAIDQAFKHAGLTSAISSAMHQKVWEKAIVNAGINAVGAMFKVPNGKIIEVPQLCTISRRLTSEAVAVARATGDITAFDGHAAVQAVLERTAANRNSMLQDIERGRKTEIDFINGAFASRGKELGIDVPWNEFIIAAIHGIEALR
jgi:2-dehydropantoate 2-reductase